MKNNQENIKISHKCHRIVCPVVRPLVLLVGPAHQRPLEVMHIIGAAVVKVPAACLTGARARRSSNFIFIVNFPRVIMFPLVSPVMRPLWRAAAEAALVAVTAVTQGVIHLLLSKLESLLGLDAKVPGLHGVHGEVARVPQAAPLGGADPHQATIGRLQAQQEVHELLRLGPVLLLHISSDDTLNIDLDMTHLAGDVVHDEEGDGPLVVPGDLAGVGVTAPELSPESLGLVNIRLVSGGLSLSSLSSSLYSS